MAEHEDENRSAQRPLNKALWMKALDELEREYHAFQRLSLSPVGAPDAPQKLAQTLPQQPT